MLFHPTHHFIQVEKVALREVQPDKDVDDRSVVFRVVAVGPGFLDPMTGNRIPMSVAAGDYVVLDSEQIIGIGYLGINLMVCPETAVLGRVEF